MRKFTFFIIVVLIFSALGAGFWFWQRDIESSQAIEVIEEAVVPSGPLVEVEERVVEDGDTFTSVMEDLGVEYSEALKIVEKGESIFDFTSIKLGKTFRLIKEDHVPQRIEYEPGTEYMVVIDLQQDFMVQKQDIPYDIELDAVGLTINNSMYVDGLESGMSEELIIAYAEVFAWEIDFATAVQKGDKMTVLYEKRFRNGEESGIGDVLAGTFTNHGETVTAYRYTSPDGSFGYYDEEGNSLIRPFLKAPLHFSRISSGFSYARFHPITGKTTPHRAIDYAAPLGTPIRAVGDGVIKKAAWNGGYGNYISIRHNERFTTNYAHLSRYADIAKPGTRVKQGDIIGYVGSTGFSTGPHLHYEVEVDGVKVNPLEVEFPKGDSISEEEKESFLAEKDRLKNLLKK